MNMSSRCNSLHHHRPGLQSSSRLPLSAGDGVLALVFQHLNPSMPFMGHSPVTENVVPFQLFEMFKHANRSSLNSKIVESSDELQMVGWIAPYTLLVNAPKEDLDALKTAWSRRTLRSPKIFMLVELAIVKDFAVESILRLQFLPLSSTLCDAIRELDRNGECTTRDSIIKYLKNEYHNVTIPPENIIHKCLGKLIEQRKIYHNGVGYHALIDSSPFKRENVERTEKQIKICDISETTVSDNNNHQKIKHKASFCEKTRSCVSKKDEKPKKGLCYGTKLMDIKPGKATETLGKNRHPSVHQGVFVSSHNFSQEGQEIKIIDISAEASIIHMSSNAHSLSKRQLIKPVSPRGASKNCKDDDGSVQNFSKDASVIHSCKIKLRRSRSFSSRSAERTRNRDAKLSAVDSDFPLRRAMGEEELRFLFYDMRNKQAQVELDS